MVIRMYSAEKETCPTCKRANVAIRATGVNEHGDPDGPLWVCEVCDHA